MKSFMAALRSLVLPVGRTSGKRIVLDGDQGVVRVYGETDALAAEITTHDDVLAEPGFIAYQTSGTRYAAHLAGGALWFFVDAEYPDLAAYIDYRREAPTAGVSMLRLASGYVGGGSGAWESAVVELHSHDGTTGPKVVLQGDADAAYTRGCDLEVHGDVIGGQVPVHRVKTSSVDRTTSVLTDDGDLQVTLEPNSTYLVEASYFYGAVTGVGFRAAWSVPSGATGRRRAAGLGSAATTYDSAAYQSGVHGLTMPIVYGHRNSSTSYVGASEDGWVTTGATGGTLAVQWAQVTTSATPTRLAGGSSLKVTKVG